jgi:hypothetical protein
MPGVRRRAGRFEGSGGGPQNNRELIESPDDPKHREQAQADLKRFSQRFGGSKETTDKHEVVAGQPQSTRP